MVRGAGVNQPSPAAAVQKLMTNNPGNAIRETSTRFISAPYPVRDPAAVKTTLTWLLFCVSANAKRVPIADSLFFPRFSQKTQVRCVLSTSTSHQTDDACRHFCDILGGRVKPGRVDDGTVSRVSGTEPLISGTRSTTNLDKVIRRCFSVSRELWSPEFWLRNELVRGRQVQELPARRKRLRGDPGIHR